MIKPDRIPCINPHCNRTAPVNMYPSGTEIICRACLKALPARLRNRFKRYRGAVDLYGRQMKMKKYTHRTTQLVRMQNSAGRLLDKVWVEMKASLVEPESPAGLDAFLNEIGLD